MPGQRFARQRRAGGQPGARTPRPTTIPRPVPHCAWRPAADNLAAGRDLLHTHFTTDQSGWRHGTSPWAPPIARRQVNGALAGEIGGYTEHLAAGALQAAAAGSAERLPACCASLRMETRRHAFEQDRHRNPLASGNSSMNVAAAAVARDSHGSASITVTDGDRTERCTDPRAGCRSPTMNCERRGQMRRHLRAYLPVRVAIGGRPGRSHRSRWWLRRRGRRGTAGDATAALTQPNDAVWSDLSFPSATTGVVVCSTTSNALKRVATVYRTTDAGHTWHPLSLP